jgi:hypothetical protein
MPHPLNVTRFVQPQRATPRSTILERERRLLLILTPAVIAALIVSATQAQITRQPESIVSEKQLDLSSTMFARTPRGYSAMSRIQ